MIGCKPRGARTIGRVLRDVDAVVQPGGGQHDLEPRALLHRETERRRDHALEVHGSVTWVRIRLVRDELPEARLPVAAQRGRRIVRQCAHRRTLCRAAGARLRVGLRARFASATPIDSRAQAASWSGSSSTSAGTCQYPIG